MVDKGSGGANLSQVNIGPRCLNTLYCGLYSGIEFPETGYDDGDWVLYNTIACGRKIAGESYWCEIMTYRNGYGAEAIQTWYDYPGYPGTPGRLHTLDRSRYIRVYPEGPLIFFLLHRTGTDTINTAEAGVWASYVWDFTGGYWVKLREEAIPHLIDADIRGNFEFIPLKAGMPWPTIPRIDWTDTKRCATDGWLLWTPTSVPSTTFDTSTVYNYGRVNDYYKWYAGGNKPAGTDPPAERRRVVEYRKPKEPRKIKIVRTGLIQGTSGPVPRPITPEDKEEKIDNPLFYGD